MFERHRENIANTGANVFNNEFSSPNEEAVATSSQEENNTISKKEIINPNLNDQNAILAPSSMGQFNQELTLREFIESFHLDHTRVSYDTSLAKKAFCSKYGHTPVAVDNYLQSIKQAIISVLPRYNLLSDLSESDLDEFCFSKVLNLYNNVPYLHRPKGIVKVAERLGQCKIKDILQGNITLPEHTYRHSVINYSLDTAASYNFDHPTYQASNVTNANLNNLRLQSNVTSPGHAYSHFTAPALHPDSFIDFRTEAGSQEADFPPNETIFTLAGVDDQAYQQNYKFLTKGEEDDNKDEAVTPTVPSDSEAYKEIFNFLTQDIVLSESPRGGMDLASVLPSDKDTVDIAANALMPGSIFNSPEKAAEFQALTLYAIQKKVENESLPKFLSYFGITQLYFSYVLRKADLSYNVLSSLPNHDLRMNTPLPAGFNEDLTLDEFIESWRIDDNADSYQTKKRLCEKYKCSTVLIDTFLQAIEEALIDHKNNNHFLSNLSETDVRSRLRFGCIFDLRIKTPGKRKVYPAKKADKTARILDLIGSSKIRDIFQGIIAAPKQVHVAIPSSESNQEMMASSNFIMFSVRNKEEILPAADKYWDETIGKKRKR